MKVAIINTDDDFMSGLKELLIEEGYDAITENVSSFVLGKIDVVEFFSNEEPDLVIYDIAPPYEENWHYFRLLQHAYSNIPFVVTTTNRNALERHVGPVIPHVIDVLRKPFDFNAVLQALHTAEEKSMHTA